MATIGDGIFLVILGNKYIIAIPIIANTISINEPLKCGNCAFNIIIPKALTNPTITGLGINFSKFPIFKYPNINWNTPVRIVASNIYSTP